MKPDWKDAPEWAKWLAMDVSGTWYWFEQKPTAFRDSGYWWSAEGYAAQASESFCWEESAEPRQ